MDAEMDCSARSADVKFSNNVYRIPQANSCPLGRGGMGGKRRLALYGLGIIIPVFLLITFKTS